MGERRCATRRCAEHVSSGYDADASRAGFRGGRDATHGRRPRARRDRRDGAKLARERRETRAVRATERERPDAHVDERAALLPSVGGLDGDGARGGNRLDRRRVILGPVFAVFRDELHLRQADRERRRRLARDHRRRDENRLRRRLRRAKRARNHPRLRGSEVLR